MIIRYHKEAEFNKIPKKKLIEFIGGGPENISGRIKVGIEADMKILRTWEEHFKYAGSPYAIEQRGTVLYLIKERRV